MLLLARDILIHNRLEPPLELITHKVAAIAPRWCSHIATSTIARAEALVAKVWNCLIDPRRTYFIASKNIVMAHKNAAAVHSPLNRATVFEIWLGPHVYNTFADNGFATAKMFYSGHQCYFLSLSLILCRSCRHHQFKSKLGMGAYT